MNYPGILKVVRAQNPELPYKEAQKKAKEMFAKFKAASEKLSIADVSPMAGMSTVVTTDTDVLLAAEKRIREKGVNISSIYTVGREVMPTGDLVRHDKIGVNTQVTFEDGSGKRLPVEGFFVIWI